MEAYCEEVRCLEVKFFGLELNHVAQRYNEVANELARIASGWTMVPPNVFNRDIFKPSVLPRSVAELPELFQLKCLSPALEAGPHLNGNNPSIPRI
jgi:hypothetical protein